MKDQDKKCCEKCLGSYGFGKDNWGCIDKGCPCHQAPLVTQELDSKHSIVLGHLSPDPAFTPKRVDDKIE